MHQPIALALLSLWAGLTLLLGELRVVRRPSLAQRVAPYGRAKIRDAVPMLDVRPWREVVGPLCRAAGERIAALFGVSEDAGARLERLGWPLDATEFRVRQVGWA